MSINPKPLVKSGKTFEYESTGENKIGQGTFGIVFGGIFKSGFEEGKAAIKRVALLHGVNGISDIEDDRELRALKILRHPCIVILYAVEDDDNFRNYVFELCEETLEDYINKRYEDQEYRNQVMPREVEGLFQMASGIGFIHKQNMIHRDIKPENVLIAPPQNGRARLKISDFGFTKKMEENDAIHYSLASGLKGTPSYLAPELQKLAILINKQDYIKKQKCTSATDIFAAGCTFFRYLVKGCFHPFGSGDSNIQTNIMNGNPVNMLKEYFKDPWMAELVGKMIQLNPTERLPFTAIIDEILKVHPEVASIAERESDLISPVIVVESNNIDLSKWRTVLDRSGEHLLKFNRGRRIGIGEYASVFEGIFKNEKVAVKQVQLMGNWNRDDEYESEILARLNHPNVVQYKHCAIDVDFRYIVLELCAATLDDYLKREYQGPIPTKEQVLFQLAKGLDYIHSEKIVHRDVTPAKILISYSKPIQMKWSGFGLTKPVNNRGSFFISGLKGTHNWMAPELLNLIDRKHESPKEMYHDRGTVRSDVYSSGCVILCFLLDGVHPFGFDQHDINLNVRSGNPVNLKGLPEKHFARPFIVQMIEHDPYKRISLKQVIDYLTPLQPKSRLSDMQYDKKNLLSEGLFSSVYRISQFEEAETLAVKIFPSSVKSLESFEVLKNLKHENIVRVLYSDLDDFQKYYGIELCAASLDQCFLPEEDPKKYKGPLPSDEIALFQLSSGLQFLHKKKLIHGSIRPSNILISSSSDPIIKLSDFGLTRKRWDEGSTSSGSVGGIMSSRFWLAPELLHELNNKDSITDTTVIECTEASDVFSTGSVFFYFYSRGSHLFGDQVNFILQNTQNGIQKNLFRKQHFAVGLVRWMTTIKPKKRPSASDVVKFLRLSQPLPERLRNIGNIQYSSDCLVDKGGQAQVFLGRSKGSIVAVKRMLIDGLSPREKEEVTRERKAYEKLDHRNIVKLLDFAEDGTFLVLALERCLVSLKGYCRQPLLYRGIIPMPSDKEVLLQMAEGLEYIHMGNSERQSIIHRDVKPGNILLSYDNPAVIKWADFGMSRVVLTGSNSFTWSDLKGTIRWLAPELIDAEDKKKIKGSIKCDIFALGCVFFYFLVPGVHPFGEDESETKAKIKAGEAVNIDRLSSDHFAFKIITGMIEKDPTKRINLSAAIKAMRNPSDTTNASVNMPPPQL